jgi:hypothetical protein
MKQVVLFLLVILTAIAAPNVPVNAAPTLPYLIVHSIAISNLYNPADDACIGMLDDSVNTATLYTNVTYFKDENIPGTLLVGGYYLGPDQPYRDQAINFNGTSAGVDQIVVLHNGGHTVPAHTPLQFGIHITNYLSNGSWHGLGEVFWVTFSVDCTTMQILTPPTINAVASPSLPAGFVLHTISCNTPVFDSPGGVPVGDNAIKAGQTWYVNPQPITANGKSWTEIYVSGFQNGYIPTTCVG